MTGYPARWHHEGVPDRPASYLDRLRAELGEIRADMEELLDHSTIRNVNPNRGDSDVFFVGASDWGWGPSDSEVTALQMRLFGKYRRWYERFELLFPDATPDVTERINDVDAFLRRWTQRDGSWDHSVPSTIDAAKAAAARQFTTLDDLLDLAARAGDAVPRLVPDTNALLRNPDLGSYARAVWSPAFIIHLLPTVLSELDDLKDRGRSPELRAQAQGVVRRLKGLRDKGNLAAGVALTKSITVRADAREVDVRAVLDWLDPAVPDDRIVASALRLQSDHPTGTVVLVTSDLNLQNKADAVGLPYIETPPTLASLRANLSASIRRPPSGHPVVVLANNGPATAKSIRYSVAPPPNGPSLQFTAGPWQVPRLRPGESDERLLVGVYPATVLVSVSWIDDERPQEVALTVDFPERPSR